jgi:hypothetical protein
MTGLDQSRVAEIIATGQVGSADARASGYRVTSALVLTSEHAVHGRTGISVRFNADQADEWSAPASVLWSDAVEDGALLLLQLPSNAMGVSAATYGRISDRPGVVEAQAVGFPWWKLRADSAAGVQSPSRYRDMHQALCTIATLSNSRSQTLELATSPPERRGERGRSPWEGMSGAAVWAENRIVGVVREHALAEGPNHLTATRVERLIRAMLPEIQQAIGVVDPGGLAEVPETHATPRRPASAPAGDSVRQDLRSTARDLAIGGLAWFAGKRSSHRPHHHAAEPGREDNTDGPAEDPLSAMDGDGSWVDFLDI